MIDATEGTYLVNAGTGTGKTFTVTRRYANILDQNGVEPDDLLLLTFTNHAADEIKDWTTVKNAARVISLIKYPSLKTAISTSAIGLTIASPRVDFRYQNSPTRRQRR
ncbi:UvrD-helicase domain-containing protein [Halococcus hamelinensis]|uniref:UvrD-helicase domain-containing protein n=1 Tax=Halococcus hamelinensis TaxID=332168 RepID=UPI002351E68F|nr:UvrD-helicase domain-containing protein [Halococcus hamelinensis]